MGGAVFSCTSMLCFVFALLLSFRGAGVWVPPAMSARVAPQNPHPATPPANPRGRYLARLSLLALGVVYGDIGTSPLYALREAFHGQHGIPVTPGNVLGVLSLIFWSLLLIVTVKYHVFIIRADNKGAGRRLP